MQNKLSIPIPKGIKDVLFSNEIGDTPANCNLRTRIVKLNPDYWHLLNEDQQFYVLAHEAGHIDLQTHSEHLADQYASKLYFEAKRSPKQSVFALSKVLPFTNNEQSDRLTNQLIRAAKQDYKTTKNPNALKILNKMNENLHAELDELEDSFLGDEENFGGRWAARRDLKKTSRIERKNQRTESKATARTAKAEAKILKAQSGQPGAGENIFQKSIQAIGVVGDTVGAIRGNARPVDESGATIDPSEKKILGMKAGMFYIVAGVTVIVIAVGVYLVLKPKKATA